MPGPPPPAPQPLSSPGDRAQSRPLRHLSNGSINWRYLCSPRPHSAPAPALPGPPPPPSTVRPSLLPTSGSASQTPRSVSRHVTKPPMKLPWPLLLNPSPGPPAGAGPTLPSPTGSLVPRSRARTLSSPAQSLRPRRPLPLWQGRERLSQSRPSANIPSGQRHRADPGLATQPPAGPGSRGRMRPAGGRCSPPSLENKRPSSILAQKNDAGSRDEPGTTRDTKRASGGKAVAVAAVCVVRKSP